jgi:hypothetical protein
MLVTLDHFRGLVGAVKADQTPVLELLFNGDGFELGCRGHFVKNARGERRIFRTSDAALRYVRDNVSRQLGRSVDVLVHVAAGLL